tara:strand:+ start:259 stop:525 length:267 start_codon:yes stop_codon:yes gene_type:complete
MSSKITIVISFEIESTFEKSVEVFDTKGAYLRHSEFDIKPIFNGFSKDYPKKVIHINMAPEENIKKLVLASSECQKEDSSTMEESSLI